MCYPVPCRTCGKTTWAGCGDHVDQVRSQVPPDQWCGGHQSSGAAGSAAPAAKSRSWWRR